MYMTITSKKAACGRICNSILSIMHIPFLYVQVFDWQATKEKSQNLIN